MCVCTQLELCIVVNILPARVHVHMVGVVHGCSHFVVTGLEPGFSAKASALSHWPHLEFLQVLINTVRDKADKKSFLILLLVF